MDKQMVGAQYFIYTISSCIYFAPWLVMLVLSVRSKLASK